MQLAILIALVLVSMGLIGALLSPLHWIAAIQLPIWVGLIAFGLVFAWLLGE
jgi:hypothetical protein